MSGDGAGAGAGAGSAEAASKKPAFPTILTLDEDTPVVSHIGNANDVFIDMLPILLNRLALTEDAELSKTKRVGVRGALYDPSHIGLTFSADFRDGKVVRVRLMTARDDVDKTQVPAEFGGTGLMAPSSSLLDAEDTRAAAPKRKRAKAAVEPVTLEEALARAVELARLCDRTELAAQLDALLKAC
jgi:hypothetical protein